MSKELKDLKCWNHPLQEEIVAMIKNQRSDASIERYLKDCGKPVTRLSISKFRRKLNAESYLKEKLDEVDKAINAVMRQLKMIELMEKRVDELRERELNEPNNDAITRMLNWTVKTHNDLLVSHIRMKQDIGVIPNLDNKMKEIKKSANDILTDARQKELKKKEMEVVK